MKKVSLSTLKDGDEFCFNTKIGSPKYKLDGIVRRKVACYTSLASGRTFEKIASTKVYPLTK